MRRAIARGAQCGATLIEVLVTMIITAIGLLGVATLQSRTYAVESESYQRAQAAILLEDMANRIRANYANAGDYVAASLGGGDVQICTGLPTTAATDLCEWQNLLRGAAETHDGNGVGAMLAAHSCITQPNPAERVFVVTVTWAGTVASEAPANPCGAGLYADDRLRRSLSTIIRIANLI